MATRVSWGFADITISFDMDTPSGAPERGGARGRARSTGVGQGRALRWPLRAAQERLLLLHECFPHPMLTLRKIWITGRRIFRGSAINTADFFSLLVARGQFTNRRMRTFITRPNAKKTNAVEEP